MYPQMVNRDHGHTVLEWHPRETQRMAPGMKGDRASRVNYGNLSNQGGTIQKQSKSLSKNFKTVTKSAASVFKIFIYMWNECQINE